MPEQKFEQQLTPESEKEFLRKEIEKQPERAKEIVGDYLKQEPEVVYTPGMTISREQLREMEKRITDVSYTQREEAVRYLFSVAEKKGLLYAAELAKKADPSAMDEFHDRLLNYIYSRNQQ